MVHGIKKSIQLQRPASKSCEPDCGNMPTRPQNGLCRPMYGGSGGLEAIRGAVGGGVGRGGRLCPGDGSDWGRRQGGRVHGVPPHTDQPGERWNVHLWEGGLCLPSGRRGTGLGGGMKTLDVVKHHRSHDSRRWANAGPSDGGLQWSSRHSVMRGGGKGVLTPLDTRPKGRRWRSRG